MAQKDNVTGYLMFFVFLTTVILIVYDMFKKEGVNPMDLIPSFIVFSIIFMNNYGVFSTWIKGKGFMFRTGLKGTLVSGPWPIDNYRSTCNVSVKIMYCSDKVKQRALGGFWKFYSLLSQNIVIEITDFKDKFHELEKSEDPKGCIDYKGSLNGGEIWDEFSWINIEMDRMRHELVSYKTILKHVNLQVETLAQSQDKGIVHAAHKIKSVMSNIERPIIIAGGPQGATVTDLNQGGMDR